MILEENEHFMKILRDVIIYESRLKCENLIFLAKKAGIDLYMNTDFVRLKFKYNRNDQVQLITSMNLEFCDYKSRVISYKLNPHILYLEL